MPQNSLHFCEMSAIKILNQKLIRLFEIEKIKAVGYITIVDKCHIEYFKQEFIGKKFKSKV